MLSMLMMRRTEELGVKVKDFMKHIAPTPLPKTLNLGKSKSG
jgi:hypothetical protein